MNFLTALLAGAIVKPLQKAATYLFRQKDGKAVGSAEAQAAAPLIDRAAQTLAAGAAAKAGQDAAKR